MKILLKDCDLTGFGNLALMKLSAWHKARGDEVFLNMPGDFDTMYASCVFSWNNGHNAIPATIWGGSGFYINKWLPSEIEHTRPDYSLYGYDRGYSMGFTSRGCIRECPWCIVPEKEGWIQPWASIYEFWNPRHRRVLLLDNNFLASPGWQETMEVIQREHLEVDFNQGLDIRLVTDEVIWHLKRVRCRGLRFAFDDWGDAESVAQGIDLLLKAGFSRSHLHFYVLFGYKQDPDEDYARLNLLQNYGCSIFPMIYRDGQGIKHSPVPGPIPKKMRGCRDSLRKLARLKGVIE